MTGIRKASKIEWHKQNQDKLRILWGTGASAAEIAKEFPGSTRNGILGKAHRMGLDPRKKKPVRTVKALLKPKPKRRNPVVTKPMVVPKILVEPTPPTAVVTFLELGSGTCRNVEGYSKQNGHNLPYYCANPKAESASFCPYHHGIYYQKAYR